MLTTKPRRAIALILVIFAVYAVIKNPSGAAGSVHDALDWVWNAINKVGDFFDALMKK